MQDTFQWTDELVWEFFRKHFFDGTVINSAKSALEQFKSSKSPKKEWEVVAFRMIDSPLHIVEKSDCSPVVYQNKACLGEVWSLPELLSDNRFEIFSVCRLSDASEWQVKETIEVWETGRFTIQSFEISAGQMLAKTDGGTYLLNALIKLPQPILTTVDGVEIRENEECWIVDKYYKLLPEPEKINEFKRNYYSNRFIFYTREAAEQYILNNRPLLSLNDVKEAIGSSDVFGTLALRERLTALAKQKLNQ